MADPRGVLAAGPAATTTRVEMLVVGPLGVLAVGPIAETTGVGDVDGAPLHPW
jgi:hypothetical protein